MDVAGVEVTDLPVGSRPLEVVMVVKLLDAEGDVAVTTRTSDGLSEWETAGMLTMALDRVREDMREGWVEE